MANPNPSKPFIKGDPRINRKGRPKSFDALRELAQAIAHEPTQIVTNGHKVTVAEAILRQWAQSKNPQLQRAFIEVAFGKVPDKLDVTSGGQPIVKVEYVNTPYTTADVPPGTIADSTEPEEV